MPRVLLSFILITYWRAWRLSGKKMQAYFIETALGSFIDEKTVIGIMVSRYYRCQSKNFYQEQIQKQSIRICPIHNQTPINNLQLFYRWILLGFGWLRRASWQKNPPQLFTTGDHPLLHRHTYYPATGNIKTFAIRESHPVFGCTNSFSSHAAFNALSTVRSEIELP